MDYDVLAIEDASASQPKTFRSAKMSPGGHFPPKEGARLSAGWCNEPNKPSEGRVPALVQRVGSFGQSRTERAPKRKSSRPHFVCETRRTWPTLSGMATTKRKPRKRKEVSPKTIWQIMENHDAPSDWDALMPDDAPPWVKKLAIMFMRTLFPGLKIGPELEADPKFLGALGAKATISNQVLKGQLALPPVTAAGLESFLQATKPSKALIKHATAEGKKLVQIQEDVTNETMPLVPQLKPEDQLHFMEGYTKSLRNGLEALDVSRSPVEHKIVQRFFLLWPLFARLNSVSELHKCIAVPLAKEGVVVSRDRIAKLCQRIGLRYRGRGRPKKKQNRTPGR